MSARTAGIYKIEETTSLSICVRSVLQALAAMNRTERRSRPMMNVLILLLAVFGCVIFRCDGLPRKSVIVTVYYALFLSMIQLRNIYLSSAVSSLF